MKLTTPSLVAALCWSYRHAAAATTHVYTVDTPAALSEGRIRPATELSPEIARLVLAQRAGVEDYHDADLEDDKVVSAINGYAAKEGLLGGSKPEDVLILLERQDHPLSLLDHFTQSTQLAHFTITPSPSANATRGLFLDLARQALPSYLNNIPDDEVYTLLKGGANEREAHHSRRIAIWSESELARYLQNNFPGTSKNSLAVTIITTPFTAPHGEKSASYGTYAMPAGAQSPLRKRQQPSSAEAPLEVASSPRPETHNTLPLTSLADSSEPLPGILPACFPSLSSCETTTRNCSGHGTCSKKYTDANAPKDSRFRDCYACQCSATVSDSGLGKSTTYWGGPACQKKDVSTQFWLIALFSVAMVGLVSFAVGQVWSMGEEELPSVIGAGVSGPVKRS